MPPAPRRGAQITQELLLRVRRACPHRLVPSSCVPRGARARSGQMNKEEQLELELGRAKRLFRLGVVAPAATFAQLLRTATVCMRFTEAGAAPMPGLIDEAKFQTTKSRLQLQAEALVDSGETYTPLTAGAPLFLLWGARCTCSQCPPCNGPTTHTCAHNCLLLFTCRRSVYHCRRSWPASAGCCASAHCKGGIHSRGGCSRCSSAHRDSGSQKTGGGGKAGSCAGRSRHALYL